MWNLGVSYPILNNDRRLPPCGRETNVQRNKMRETSGTKRSTTFFSSIFFWLIHYIYISCSLSYITRTHLSYCLYVNGNIFSATGWIAAGSMRAIFSSSYSIIFNNIFFYIVSEINSISTYNTASHKKEGEKITNSTQRKETSQLLETSQLFVGTEGGIHHPFDS